MKKCVFLDRDGVLNQDTDGYIFEPEKLVPPEGVAEGLQQLKNAGYLLVVITNQAGIAKGLYTREDVLACYAHQQIQFGGVLDAIYFSPHHPDFTSETLLRKPSSLMLEKAIAKFEITPETSWMIGDRERDIMAGHGAGVRGILLSRSGKTSQANSIVEDFTQAVEVILQT